MKRLTIIRRQHFCKKIGSWHCSEDERLIENYDEAEADNFKGWELHHRLETRTSEGEKREIDLTPVELNILGIYKNPPASELIYLRVKDHRREHAQSLLKWTRYFFGFHWYTNGKINIRAKDCPEGFSKGRIIKRKKHNKKTNS